MKLFMKGREGFTILEVLIVLGIIAIIGSIAVPVVGGVIKQANATKILTEMRQVQSATIQYVLIEGKDKSLTIDDLKNEELLNPKIDSNIILKEYNKRLYVVYDLDEPDIKYFKKVDKEINTEVEGRPSIFIDF